MPVLSQIEELSAIVDLQQTVTTSNLPLLEVMTLICEKTMVITQATGAVVEIAEGNEMVYHAGAGSLQHQMGLRLNIKSSLSGLSVIKNEVLYSRDTEIDERVNREACRRVGARSMICVPLLYNGVTIGVLKVVSFEVDHFIEQSVSALKLIAGFISATIAKERTLIIITESENKFRTIIEASNDSILLAKNGLTLEVNPAFMKTFGYNREEIIGKNVFDYIAPEEVEKVKSIAYAGNENPYESICIKKDGVQFPVQILGKNVIINNEIIRMTTIRDISEFKMAELILKDAVEKTNLAMKTKSEFLANMSHEIRTPLNGIMGMASLLRETQLDSEQSRYVEIMKNSAENLLTIVNDILDFSKIEAKKLSIEQIDFDLKRAVDDIFQILLPMAKEKNLEFTYTTSNELPFYVNGDPTRLRQILMNLVNNAIKFTKKGSVKIIVERGSNDDIDFHVIDTGIGISKKYFLEMFKPFSQGDNTTTRKFGGTGLGLTICKQLVDMMNGTIQVESAVDKGSHFKFTLPLPEVKNKSVEREQTKVINSGLKLRVLIAEDNPASGLIARSLVEKAGHTTVLVGNGKEVLQALELAPYDLIVLNCIMPELDGFETTKKIRQSKNKWNQIPVIAMTSNSPDRMRDKCYSTGMNKIVHIPLTIENITREINSLFAPKQTPSIERITEELSAKSLHILLVDDNEDNRTLILAYLKKFPFTIDIAENGVVAVEKMQKCKYDVVLMDIQMPEKDGLTATREFREWELKNRSELQPIIALSAYALEDEVRKSLEAGCNFHLTKPVKKSTLLEYIWSSLSR